VEEARKFEFQYFSGWSGFCSEDGALEWEDLGIKQLHF